MHLASLKELSTSAIQAELVRRAKLEKSKQSSNKPAVDETQLVQNEERVLLIQALQTLPGGAHVVKEIHEQALVNVCNRLAVAPH